MSSIYDPDDPSKALEDAARVKLSSNIDQVRHTLLLHKLANAYLTVSARMLFAKFLDKSSEERPATKAEPRNRAPVPLRRLSQA